jgi:hypothetical protein
MDAQRHELHSTVHPRTNKFCPLPIRSILSHQGTSKIIITKFIIFVKYQFSKNFFLAFILTPAGIPLTEIPLAQQHAQILLASQPELGQQIMHVCLDRLR